MKRSSLVLMLLATLACAPAAGAGSVYRWTDERGHVNFSDHPQDGRTTQKVEIETPAPPPTAGAQAADQPSAKASTEQPVIQADADQRSIREKNCDLARQALSHNEGIRRMYRTGSDGERTYLSDEEREQVLERSREDVKAWCD
jgi:hypothetical protein